MDFIEKLCLFCLGFTSVLGLVCAWLDKSYYEANRQSNRFTQELYELGYLGLLKIFTLSLFATFLILPIAAFDIAVKAFQNMITMTNDLAFILFAIAAWVAITGLMALIVASRRYRQTENSGLPLSINEAPELHDLSHQLAVEFNCNKIKKIFLTADARIRIREDISRLDDIYYGHTPTWEIGLAALQYLSEQDLKILMALEYAHYANNRTTPGRLVKSLSARLAMMSGNLTRAGFIVTFNPVAWFVAYSGVIIPRFTAKGEEIAEIQARVLVANLFNENDIQRTLTRYDVETEVYREIIQAAGARRRPGTPELENIYQHIRFDRRFASLSRQAAENILTSGKRAGRRSLMIKRLAETAYFEPALERPATDYLADKNAAEEKMMQLINNA